MYIIIFVDLFCIFLCCISYFLFCRFIGELYKQGMLTTKIMHRCTKELLIQSDEDSLECLCKLLTTIGKDLESKVSAEVTLFFIIINKKCLVRY